VKALKKQWWITQLKWLLQLKFKRGCCINTKKWNLWIPLFLWLAGWISAQKSVFCD
jgi:hypothetical protein